MPNIVLQKEKEKSWISYIKQRIKKNKNFIGFISGATGSGKSWSSLRIAEELDPEFSIERVVFNGIELMKLINSNKLKSGSAVVFEELGIELNNRSWQSVVNKMINFLLQTFRHRNFILIMNSPYMDFIDSATRKLFHAEFIMTSIDHKNKQSKIKPQIIQYNSRMQKFYYKYLRVITPEGIVPVVSWKIDKPSGELLKQYEIKKKQFTDSLNRDIYNELIQAKDKKKKQRIVVCQNCSYEWYPRGSDVPKECPKCRKPPK